MIINHPSFLAVLTLLSMSVLIATVLEYNHEAKAKIIGYSIDCSNNKCHTDVINSTSPQSSSSSSPLSPQSGNHVVGSKTVCINDNPCHTEPLNATNMDLG